MNRQIQPGGQGGAYPPPSEFLYDGSHRYAPYGYREPEPEPDSFNPLTLLLYVLRYRWLIAFLLAVGLVSGAVFTMMQTPRYKATAQLEVLVPSAKVFQDIEVVSEGTDVRSFLTAREKLKSRALAQRAVYELGLTEREDFLFPKPDFSPVNLFSRAFGIDRTTDINSYSPEQREAIAIGRVMQNLSVDLVTNTSLLKVSFSDQQPLYAQTVANQIAQSFIDQRVDQTSETSGLARQFIQEQVVQVKDRLQQSEKALVEYAKEVGITVTGDENSLISANMTAINGALAKAIEENLEYGRLVQQIEAGRGDGLEQVLASEGLASIRSRIAELSAEYQQKLSLFKPGFPEMKQLESQIQELRKQAENGVTVITESIRLKHEETQTKVADLRAKLAELEAEQAAYQDKNIQYTILKRDVESYRSQYESLIDKLNDIGVGADLKNQNAAIVDLAVLPGGAYSPSMTRNVALALALFAMFGAALIYILELLNNTFSNPEQVETELGLPVLGILPSVDEKEIVSALADQRSGISEAYRSLRTALQFSGTEGMPRTLLVTSSEPSEGKSTTAFKLAQDFASLNTSVLLVDADMRKPNLHRLFGLDNTLGLSNLLTNTIRREDYPKLLRQTKYPNVSILTSGTIPPNPADLLSSSRMAAALSGFSKRYDLVIIDAPPIVGLSDAPILSRLADGSLLVVSANQVTRKSATNALKRLRAAGASVLGTTLSKFSVSRLDYNYAYRYINSDYYSYGAETPRLAGTTGRVEEEDVGQDPTLGDMARGVRSRFGAFLARIKQAR
jgi:succinoglycan biosynthesis transport protein ExoP